MQKIRLERPADCKFDERLADRAVEFFSKHLRHTKGRQFYGRPFHLAPFQEHDIREIFGRVDDQGRRTVREVYWEIPKKNGKSAVASGIALKMLFADSEPGAEVYGAATERDQAKIVFEVARQQVEKSPDLKRRAKIYDSQNRLEIHYPGWGYYKAVSKVGRSKHGFNPSAIVFDEIHALPDRQLWNVLTGGSTISREQPLTFAITTAGVEGESPVAEELHNDAVQILKGVVPCPPEFYPVVYAPPEKASWDDPEVWRLVNPAIGHFLDIKAIQIECDKAKRRGPADRAHFKQMHVNIWRNAASPWIELAKYDACEHSASINELRDYPCYIGLDLSSKLDLTALVVVWRLESGRWIWAPFYWLPEETVDSDKIAGDRYRQWAEDNWIELTPGTRIDYKAIREKAVWLRDHLGLRIEQIGYDPAFATEISQNLAAAGFEMVELRQSFPTFTEPCLEIEAAIAEKTLETTGNPVLRWNFDCVRVRRNTSGQMRPDKPDRLRTKKRIDGVVGGLMGSFCAIRDAGDSGAPGIGIAGVGD